MSENKVNESVLTGNNNLSLSKKSKRKPWPEYCVWPEPLAYGEGPGWDEEFLPDPTTLDEITLNLLDVKEYFDSLVECGRLNEDYTLNEGYEEDEDAEEVSNDEDEFAPEKGEDFWDEKEQRFLLDCWEYELTDRLNLIKIDCDDIPFADNPVIAVREVIGYEFINENLLRQAFTRRAFAVEYGLPGCNEELEFLGDTVLNTVVTQVMLQQLSQVNEYNPDAPFDVRFQEGGLKENAEREIVKEKPVSQRQMLAEGVLTRIRSRFVSKEYLAQRAVLLGLDKLILYGTGEEPTESSREDMMEALIGAVTMDCNWNWDVIAGVVDKLICVQLSKPDLFLKASYYDIFNAWHQRRFGSMPEYELHGYKDRFDCTLRYRVPANDKGIAEWQRIDDWAATRSEARERVAWEAYTFVIKHGLWVNLTEANMVPDRENSINQLQELYQKKYLEQLPVYEFEERDNDQWYCLCSCGCVSGMGQAVGKTKAKKRAAYMALVELFSAAGICKDEWREGLWDGIGV